MKISVRSGLPHVDYVSNEKTENLKNRFIELLKENLKKKHGICFNSQFKEDDVDLIKTKQGEYGFAFACSKFDENFKVTLQRGGFRYKDKEVRNALSKIIEELDLSSSVKYDRGMGVFVWNIFLKD